MPSSLLLIAIFLIACIATQWIFPNVLNVAFQKNIVDNPDARKLQRRPVPVLGGACVFFGVVMGLCFAQLFFNLSSLFPVMCAMTVMLCVGIMDDIIDLSPKTRFIVEILVVLVTLCANGYMIDSFHGLWGLSEISVYIAVPLAVVAAVGIINAINLVDGVDGLSTGYCMMASSLFGIMAAIVGDWPILLLAVISVGALLPFFLHNVFGKTTKMFIGDGGTLMMGVMISAFVMNMLNSDALYDGLASQGLGLIPFTLAVLAVPVFDTLRVMLARIVRGNSPFKPDKTHLHHLFIELGFSHVGATVSILSLNTLVVACWFVAYKLGWSIDVQLYVVLTMSLAITFGFYKLMRMQIAAESKLCRVMRRIGKRTHIEQKGVFLFLQKVVDSSRKEQADQPTEEKKVS